MKRFVFVIALTVTASLGSTQQAAAQGALIDFIHKLSGPTMLGPQVSYFTDGDGVRLRATVSGRWAVAREEETIKEGHGVDMFGFQPTLEIPVFGEPDGPRFETGFGFSLNRYGGEGHDAFYALHFPVYGQLRFEVGSSWYLRIGIAGYFFPKFNKGDFVGPGEVEPGVMVETENNELTWGLMLGLDWR